MQRIILGNCRKLHQKENVKLQIKKYFGTLIATNLSWKKKKIWG